VLRFPKKLALLCTVAAFGLGALPAPWAPVPEVLAAQSASKKKSTVKKSTVKKRSSSAKKRSAKRSSSKASSSAQEKKRVEGERASVEKKISAMQREISAKEARSEKASQDLKKADQAISSANKRLRSLRKRKSSVENEISDLHKRGNAVALELRTAEDTVEQIARAQFLNARRSVWQDFINGVNPNSLARDGGKLRYLAAEQAEAISVLEDRQSSIERVSQARQKQYQELQRIQKEEESERRGLIKEKSDRQQALGKLQKEIKSQQASLEKLKKDQARLSSLVAQIDARILRERKEAEAAAAREEARRRAEAKRSGKKSTITVPRRPVVTGYNAPAVGAFGRLKGKLTRPVSGRIVGRYGTARAGQAGAVWQGLQFSAPEGTDVVAAAPGKVVFADWLRGFGNLIIIDHGDTYMTVYANNESLFKNAGDVVKQGETISSVGTSGGNSEPGLYFEIRYKGKPINPTPWLR
jgi:septal ring factor EnvC (AmiA/AmiB activator)